jgi:hypothetical protein
LRGNEITNSDTPVTSAKRKLVDRNVDAASRVAAPQLVSMPVGGSLVGTLVHFCLVLLNFQAGRLASGGCRSHIGGQLLDGCRILSKRCRTKLIFQMQMSVRGSCVLAPETLAFRAILWHRLSFAFRGAADRQALGPLPPERPGWKQMAPANSGRVNYLPFRSVSQSKTVKNPCKTERSNTIAI